MVLDHDKVNSRLALSTKTLEPNPGDILRDINGVFEKAEEVSMYMVCVVPCAMLFLICSGYFPCTFLRVCRSRFC
jgi:hypothetical protein